MRNFCFVLQFFYWSFFWGCFGFGVLGSMIGLDSGVIKVHLGALFFSAFCLGVDVLVVLGYRFHCLIDCSWSIDPEFSRNWNRGWTMEWLGFRFGCLLISTVFFVFVCFCFCFYWKGGQILHVDMLRSCWIRCCNRVYIPVSRILSSWFSAFSLFPSWLTHLG